MITTNIPKNNPFNIAFIMRNDIPKELIKDRQKPVVAEAMIDKVKKNIEIHDFHAVAFDAMYLVEYIVKLGTGQTVESVQNGLVKRFGQQVRSSLIYIILYKEI
jgi:hypothetical protein